MSLLSQKVIIHTIFPVLLKPLPSTVSLTESDQLPECAKECVKQSTSSTPCPYWDTGCLCVMPQFAGAVGNCVAKTVKEKKLVLLNLWPLPFVHLLVFGNHTG